MRPKLFIGSSVEGKPIADAIQLNFTHDALPVVWDQMVFLPSGYAIDALLRAVAENDFGILVLSPDDAAKIRGATAVVPRGNVLFEAALFIGKHGRDRCFLVQPRNHPAFTLPSDLNGIIPATYDEGMLRHKLGAALGPPCTQIREAIKTSASFARRVTVESKLELNDPATSTLTYPKKLKFKVTNKAASAVAVRSVRFEMGTIVQAHPDRSIGSNQSRVEFLAYRDASGTDIYVAEILLQPGGGAIAWLALENGCDDKVVRDSWARGEVGAWHYNCRWLDEPMEMREHEDRF